MSLSECRSANETFFEMRWYSNGWLSNAIVSKKKKKRKNILECINSRRSDNIISFERCENRSNVFASCTLNFEINARHTDLSGIDINRR